MLDQDHASSHESQNHVVSNSEPCEDARQDVPARGTTLTHQFSSHAHVELGSNGGTAGSTVKLAQTAHFATPPHPKNDFSLIPRSRRSNTVYSQAESAYPSGIPAVTPRRQIFENGLVSNSGEAASTHTPSASVSGSSVSMTSLAERRRRGESSCAECLRSVTAGPQVPIGLWLIGNDRLKMRCDKRVPCKPCVVRSTINMSRMICLTVNTASWL
jgi:hypothetical protein